jgi:uncharacterized protein (DUF433 family)
MRGLLDGLDEAEASLLPQAWRLVLPLLNGEPERLWLASRVAVAFDLFETTPALVALAHRTRDSKVMLAAASLAANPGSPEATFQSAQELVDVGPSAIREALVLRLSPVQDLALTHRDLYWQAWPGSTQSHSPTGPPVVAVEAMGPNPLEYWRFVSDLVDAGALVRRIPAEWSRTPYEEWLAVDTPTVIWSPGLVGRLRAAAVLPTSLIGPGDLSNPTERIRLLRKVMSTVPGRLRFEHVDSYPGIEVDPLDPTVFRSGSFDALELAFLGGGSMSSVYKLGRDDVLIPRRHAATGGFMWSFSQLVAFRTWRYLTVVAEARPKKDLLKRLEWMAEGSSVTVAAATSHGSLLQKTEEGFMDVLTNQEVFEGVVSMDEIFNPFEIGGGRVPHLLAPSHHVTVHPSRLGGAPALTGHRISARAIAELDRKHGWGAVRSAYPRVSEELLTDGLGVGEKMLSKS